MVARPETENSGEAGAPMKNDPLGDRMKRYEDGAVLMPGLSVAQESDNSTTTPEMPTPVFEPPPEEELAKISHPELRDELLLMIYEDQEPRRRGP